MFVNGFQKTYAKIFPLFNFLCLVINTHFSFFQFLKGNLCLVELFEINSTLFCNNRDIVCVQSLPRLVIEWILVGHGMICVHMNIELTFLTPLFWEILFCSFQTQTKVCKLL